ncbi:MAG TPA: IclR family transcriptional regulator C-terminal domain-containing protein [Novosphingobium sp.]|nr:IclR family transcriptional regulator C-terminal domain-containing protein [Novosphingobium sp.]HZV09015.1 IclR family transcriptional regulator C-terminal domain-containing protein [Novosphingobium sp.]
MATSDSRTIKSAHRVLEILEYFDQNRTHATVMDMARSLSYPQSSTSELLRCLTRLGYLHYNRFRRTYSPTARVALLGSWVRPSLFRGGALLHAIDSLCEKAGQTVVLSSACNYVVQHLHVVQGAEAGALPVHVGDAVALLHSAQGKLLLSSYTNEQVRSVVHRLNAEAGDQAHHVKIADFLDELEQMRKGGWAVAHGADGHSAIAAILPPLRGMDRMAISLVATTDQLLQRESELLAAVLHTRDEVAKGCAEAMPCAVPANVVPMKQEMKILSYRRHYA